MTNLIPPPDENEATRLRQQMRRLQVLVIGLLMVVVILVAVTVGLFILRNPTAAPLPTTSLAANTLTPTTTPTITPTPQGIVTLDILSDDATLPADGVTRYTLRFTVENLPADTQPDVRLDGTGRLSSETPILIDEIWQLDYIASATAGQTALQINIFSRDGAVLLATDTVYLTLEKEPLQLAIENIPDDGETRIRAEDTYRVRVMLSRSDGNPVQGDYQLLAGLDTYDTALLNGEESQQTITLEDNQTTLVFTAPQQATLQSRTLTLSVRNQNVPPTRMSFFSRVPLANITWTNDLKDLQMILRQSERAPTSAQIALSATNINGDPAPDYPLTLHVEPVYVPENFPAVVTANSSIVLPEGLPIATATDGTHAITLRSAANGGMIRLVARENFFGDDISATTQTFITGQGYQTINSSNPRDVAAWQDNRALQLADDAYFGMLYDLNGGRRAIQTYEILVLGAAQNGRIPVMAYLYVPRSFVQNGTLNFVANRLDDLRRAPDFSYLPVTIANNDGYYEPPNPLAILASDSNNSVFPLLYFDETITSMDVVGGGEIRLSGAYAVGTMGQGAIVAP